MLFGHSDKDKAVYGLMIVAEIFWLPAEEVGTFAFSSGLPWD